MVSIRRATLEDAGWITELVNGEETEPFLSGARAFDEARIREEIERSLAEPERFGRFVVELDRERAGVMGFEERSAMHRIAHLGGLAVHPDHRGRGVADQGARLLQAYLFDELGFHRLELACYAYNDRAIRHAERVGFVREGVKRRAYLRHGEWQDAVEFGLLADERLPPPGR
jgi:RimJ/RimL family protein N-acetyltransferase